jgi:hypothetical protein
LCEKMYNMIKEWGIENKLFFITLDNASFNDTFVKLLRDQLNIRNTVVCFCEFFNLHCCAHILNLIIQDG